MLLSLVFCSSCRNNRLRTNEEELAKNILRLEEEKEKTLKVSREKQDGDTLKLRSKAFRHKEDRIIDQTHPPKIIDIVGNLENIKEITLSDIASDITYIRMEAVPDSSIPTDLKFKYYLMDNYIVALNHYGIHLYSKDGRYIRSIVKNEYTGVEVRSDRILFWNDYTKIGGGLEVRGIGNSLFYIYSNNITGHRYIMEYDCSSTQIAVNSDFDPENPDQISGLGNVLIDLNHGNTEPPKPRKHQGMFSGSPEFFMNNRGAYMFNPNSYALPTTGENMMVILNNQGDTLSKFAQLEQLTNYSKSLMRNTDGGTRYENKGKLYFRTPFSDTIFQVIPPNRLFPVFVLNLGSYKVSKQQGVDPDYKLSGKIIPGEFAETKNYIFLTFTKDDYDCPNTRKNKTVKIYYGLYSKSDHKFSIIKGDPFNYAPEIMKNDIDGGIPVWPSSYMVGNNGEILISLKGIDLKERVESEQFEQSRVSESKKNKLKQLAASVSEFEDILMIVK